MAKLELKKVPALQTIRLVPFSEAYCTHVVRWAEDPENAEFFRRTPPLRDWLNPDLICKIFAGSWIVCEEETPVGIFVLTNHDPSSRSVEIGVMISKKESAHRGHTSSEVIQQALDYLLNYKNYYKLYAKILITRLDFKKKLESFGCYTEATLKDSTFYKGKYRDEYLLAFIKKEN